MPDYNLGRAHGEVVITADTRDVTRGMGEYEQATKRASDAAKDQSRIEEELTRRRKEAEDAVRRRKEAEVEYTRVTKDSKSSVEEQIRVELRRDQARDHSERSTRRLIEAERAFQSAVRGNNAEVTKFLRTLGSFGDGVDRHGRKLKDFRQEIENTAKSAGDLSGTLLSVVGVVSKVVGLMAAGGAAGGLLGLLGGGGIQGILSATEAVKDFSGALLLLPALAGGLAVVIGTLAVAFHGVGEALGAMDDPTKFTEALRKLAPAAAQAITIITSFRDAMKGAMLAVQQSLFQPLVDQIQPLITTWLPALMRAGQAVANVLGQAGRAVAQCLQQPAAMQAFTTFIDMVVRGLNGILPAITPILNAFTTLSVIGSQFFPQLAEIIVRIANAFNNWVQGAAQSGALQQWIQTAITSFEQLFQAIGNVLGAAENIGRAFQAAGSQGFLDWLVSVTQAFKEWTQSAEGTQILTTFFQNLHQASVLLGPVLRTVGVAVLQLVNNLLQLGISMGPGIQSFFNSLAVALNSLGQSLVASGPALGEILVTVGNALVQIVQQVGPQLPQLFQSFATAAINLTPALVAIAATLAEVMANLTPGDIEVILGIIAALQVFSTVTPIVLALGAAITFLTSPIGLLVAAVAVAAIAIASNWDSIKSAFTEGWDAISSTVSKWWDSAYDWGKNIVTNITKGIRDWLSDVGSAASEIGQTLYDFLFTSSPAKKGPLSRTSPNQMGQSVAQNFAQGISSSTNPNSAAAGLAGGLTGTPFTSAGRTGKSGRGGDSGFDQWIDTITQDLRSWSALAQGAFNLFKNVADVVVNTTKVVASLWNKGDNPLTRPGGIAGVSPGLTPEQQQIPGVQNAPGARGKAPLPNLVPPDAPVPQQSLPDVPSATPPGAPPPTPAAPPGAAPPGAAATPGVATVPLVQNPDGTWTSPDPAWKALITRESNGRNVLQGDIPGDPNVGANKAQGIFQITPDTWRRHGGEEFAANPMAASPQQQAIIAARILQRNPSGSDWGAGLPGRESAPALNAGLTVTPPAVPPVAPPPVAPTAPGAPGLQRRGFEISPTTPGGPGGGTLLPGTPLQADLSDVKYAGSMAVLSVIAGKLLKSGVKGALANRAAKIAAAGEVTDPAGAGITAEDIASVSKAGTQMGIPEAQAVSNLPGVGEAVISPADLPTGPISRPGAPATVNGRPLPPGGRTAPAAPAPAPRPLPPPTPAAAPKPAPTPAARPTPTAADVPVRGPLSGLSVGIGANLALGVLTMIPATLDTLDQIDRLEAYQKAVSEGKAAPITEDELAELRQRPGLLTDANVKRLGAINTAPGVRPITAADLGGTPNLPAGQVDPHTLSSAGKPVGAQAPPVPPASTTGGAPGSATSLGPYGLPAGYGGQGAAIPESAGLGPLSKFFNIHGTTYAGHQEGSGKNQGIDWWPAGKQIEDPGKVGYTREEADRLTAYAKWVGTQPGVGQVIYMNPYTGEKVGYHNGQPVGPDMPGTTDKGYYRDDWGGHTGHVHTLFTQTISAPTGAPVPDGQAPPTPAAPAPAPPTPTTRLQPGQPGQPGKPVDTGQMRMPAGWDINTPIPNDVRRAHGISDNLPPMYYPAEPGTVTNIVPPEGYAGPVSPGGTISTPMPGAQVGFPGQNNKNQLPFGASSPLDAFSQGVGAVSSIAGDAFTVFNDFITNIKAGADMFDTLVRGFENTEDINKFIDNFQTFIKTGADIAKLVGDVGGIAGAAGGASGMPGGGAPGAAIQAIAGIVQSALEATNAAIDLGQMAWQQISKYGAIFAGIMLGGADTGPLGGNVRMLLNTNSGQIYAYSQEDPLNKSTHNMPQWLSRAYGNYGPNQQPPPRAGVVNIYAGPGQSPKDMMSESMWLVSTGGASVASVAGQE